MEETAPRPRILIVDDDPQITAGLARGLALHGYDPVSETRLDKALARIRSDRLDGAIVDVMLGSESGYALVRAIRNDGGTYPVLMLSALSDVEDRATGLEAGADDYIVKPFAFAELVARLKVQQRRHRPAPPGRLNLVPRGRIARGPQGEVGLTEREFALLELLLRNAGRVLSRGEIYDSLWGAGSAGGTGSENVVDVYIGYLRRKLSPPEDFGAEIRTVRNRGFVLVDPDETALPDAAPDA